MDKKTSRFRNELRDRDGSLMDNEPDSMEERNELDRLDELLPERKKSGRFWVFVVLGFMVLMVFNNPFKSDSFSLLNIFKTENTIFTGGPSTELLNSMGNRMNEMGYTGLSHDDLRALRRDGVTATYISNLRAIGFTDLTLEEAVKLGKANASTAFISMMIELGYELTIEEIVMLRDAGVTAHFTSNIHDLGYRDVTLNQLVRLRRIGVTVPLIERLQSERGEDITLEEIIRYRISNQ